MIFNAKYVKCNHASLAWCAYRNGRKCLSIVGEYGPVCTCSVNLPDEPMAADEMAIKDYSENQGVLMELVRLGIIAKPNRFVQSGYVNIGICKVLV